MVISVHQPTEKITYCLAVTNFTENHDHLTIKMIFHEAPFICDKQKGASSFNYRIVNRGSAEALTAQGLTKRGNVEGKR